MKKQYVFIIMIIIILYISFLIISYTYKEHITNSSIEYIKALTKDVEKKIDSAKKVVEYKTSRAYKNKVLKEQQSFKNVWEKVVYFTTEENFNKYTTIEEKKPETVITNDNNCKRFQYLGKMDVFTFQKTTWTIKKSQKGIFL